MPAKLRKHRLAFIALATFNLTLFFPVLFMGRVVSPNDVFYNFDPWALQREHRTQNSQINDPPTAYLPLMALLKEHREAFHWNPYIACGIPGFGSSAAAVLSPLVALPTLALPLNWVYTGIIFLKLNLAYLFAYFWLREERLGKRGAAIGAIIAAGAGTLTVRWLWQVTNATVFYPALLWMLCRAFRGRRTPIAILTILALSYALSGFPATMSYGALLTLVYALYLTIRTRQFPVRSLAAGLVAAALALVIALPSLVPFIQFVRRTGYLAMRETMSAQYFYPPERLLSFLDPDRIGHPSYKSWRGGAAPFAMDNFIEATVYQGLAAVILIPLALFNRRARRRGFWIATFLVIMAAMFGTAGIPRLLAALPGFRYSPLTRLTLVLPIPAAYLAAAGAGFVLRHITLRRRALTAFFAAAIAVAASADLALFAGRFHPYLPRHATVVPDTPTIAFLRAQPGPFRIAPFFNYFWPNAGELFQLEDIRSHFGSEERYRQLMYRLDPTSWSGLSTVIQFNSLHFNFDDPLAGFLGVRYFVEHRAIDILRWKISEATVAGVKGTGGLTIKPGDILERTVRIDAEPFYAIEVPAVVTAASGEASRLSVSLLKGGTVIYVHDFTPAYIRVLDKIYIPLRAYARAGEEVRLRLQSFGVTAQLGKGAARTGDSPLYYGRVMRPLIFDRELPDGRLFVNLTEVPRFQPVSRVRNATPSDFLGMRDIDFSREAVITDPAIGPMATSDGALARLLSYAPAEQRIRTESGAPFFLASSEKLTPELRVTIDGTEARPVEINLLFAGVAIPAGSHEVVFSRRIARGWWGLAGVGVVLWALIAVAEIFVRRRPTS